MVGCMLCDKAAYMLFRPCVIGMYVLEQGVGVGSLRNAAPVGC